MHGSDIELLRKRGAVRGRESRTQTVTTKLTRVELEQLEAAAKMEGKTPGEWLRDVALQAARVDTGASRSDIVLAEIVGVRLLLVNVLQRFIAGQTPTPYEFDRLLDEISEAKFQLSDKLVGEGRK